MALAPAPAFRFDAVSHRYFAEGEERPHCTGLLEAAGLVDDTWFTEESSIRGSAVHALTAAYDLDALDPHTTTSLYKGYLLAHVAAMQVIPHRFDKIEEPTMHPEWFYGVRPDRVGLIYDQQGVLEGKSTAAPSRAHEIQTALQVLAESYGHPVPPEFWWRGCLYWKPNGKWTLIQHHNRSDFDEARRILKRHCPPPRAIATRAAANPGRMALADRRRHRRDLGAAGDRRSATRRAAVGAGRARG